MLIPPVKRHFYVLTEYGLMIVPIAPQMSVVQLHLRCINALKITVLVRETELHVPPATRIQIAKRMRDVLRLHPPVTQSVQNFAMVTGFAPTDTFVMIQYSGTYVFRVQILVRNHPGIKPCVKCVWKQKIV